MRKTQNHLLGSLCAAMLLLIGAGNSGLVQAQIPPPGSSLLLTSFQGQGTTNVGMFSTKATFQTNLVTMDGGAFFMSEQAPTGYVGVLAVKGGVGGGWLVDVDGHIRAAYTNTPPALVGVGGAGFVEFGPDGLGCPNCNAYVAYGDGNGNGLGQVKRYSLFGTDLGTFTSGYVYDRSTEIYFNGAYMYLIDYNNNKVVRFNATTGVYDPTWSIGSVFGSTTLTFMPGSTNDLLIGYSGDVKHYKLTATGGTDLGIFANFAAHAASVNEMAYGPDGNLYGNDTSAHQSILVFDGTTGSYIASYNSNVAGYSRGEGLAFIIPEPAPAGLICSGLASLFWFRRQQRSR